MKGLSFEELIRALKVPAEGSLQVLGTPAPDLVIDDILVDSRKVKEGGLFAAFNGERTDGHDYIAKAFETGAAVVLASNEEKARKVSVPEGRTLVLVADVAAALGHIAIYVRHQFDGPVVGITGSVGKTSTKDLTAAILSGHGRTLKTQGNLNNELGLPMTMMKLTHGIYEAAVLEMGLDRKGDIDYLASLAKPEIGIVTNVGTSHIENFGSQEGILHAKLEIAPHLTGMKKLFLNGDDPLLYSMKDRLPVKPEYFGKEAHNDCRLLEAGRAENGMLQVKAAYQGVTYEVRIDTLGLHMAMNVLPGIMAAAAMGETPEEIREGLTHYEATPHRLQRVEIEKYLLIDDTYNASPTSMNSAIDTLMQLRSRGRHVAVLGDIKEMGSFSQEGHRQVGVHAARAGVERLLCCGEEALHIYKAALEEGMDPSKAYYFKDLASLMEEMPGLLEEGDTVLLKASHSMEFARLIDLLS